MKYTLANLTVLGSFAVLTSLAYGRAYVAPLPHTVYQQPTAEVDMASKEVVLWHADKKKDLIRKQAAVLAMVYHVSSADLDGDIFGEPK